MFLQLFKSLFIGLAVLALTIGKAEIVSGPENTVIIEGRSLRLNCEVKYQQQIDRLTWSKNDKQIYSAKTNISENFTRFSVSVKANTNTLFTNSVQLEDAGVYSCKTTTVENGGAGTIHSASAEVIVLVGDPECSSTQNSSSVAEDETVEMKCTLRFRGNWSPVMNWTSVGLHQPNPLERISNESTPSSFTSRIRLNGSEVVNGLKFLCTTFFSPNERRINGSATNVPEYNYTWASLTLSSKSRTTTLRNSSIAESTTKATSVNEPPNTAAPSWITALPYVLGIVCILAVGSLVAIISLRKSSQDNQSQCCFGLKLHLQPDLICSSARGSQGEDSMDQNFRRLDIYSEVAFEDQQNDGSEHYTTALENPEYEIVSERNLPENHPPMTEIIGSDGLEYLTMNQIQNPNPNPVFNRMQPSNGFETSIYLNIDHTATTATSGDPSTT